MNVYSRVSNYRLDNVFIIPTRFALVNALILIDNASMDEAIILSYKIKIKREEKGKKGGGVINLVEIVSCFPPLKSQVSLCT